MRIVCAVRGGHVKEIKTSIIHGFTSSFSETELIEFKSANFGDHGPIDWIGESRVAWSAEGMLTDLFLRRGGL